MEMHDMNTCYGCGATPARFTSEMRSHNYPDLVEDDQGMVKVPLCGHCRSLDQWEDEEPMDLRGL